MSIFSVGKEERDLPGKTHDLDAVLARISAGASGRDAHPSFPEECFLWLESTGALAIPVPEPIGSQGRRATFAEEWHVLRSVAGADGSVGRILDGHFNGVERVSLLAPEPLRSRELEAIVSGNSSSECGAQTRFQARESRLGSFKTRAEQGSPVSKPSVRVRRAWIARSCSCVAPPRDRASSPTSTSPKA